MAGRRAPLRRAGGTSEFPRRRLFEEIDEAKAPAVVDAYRSLWTAHGESLSAEAAHPETAEAFLASYPLHPEVLETLTGKTATLAGFQRMRGSPRSSAPASDRERPR